VDTYFRLTTCLLIKFYQLVPSNTELHTGFGLFTLYERITLIKAAHFSKSLNASNFWTIYNETILAPPPQKLACPLFVFSMA
jgi:hypothetical protein